MFHNETNDINEQGQQMLDDFATYIGVKAGTIMAGTFGSMVSMAVISGPIWYRLCLFMGGLISSAYVTPLVVNSFELGKSENAVAFLVGMFGMSIAAAIIRTVQDVNFDSLMTQIRAWLGRK